MAALGELAATVAHEINNPLQFLSLNVEALAKQGEPGAMDMLADIEVGLRRIRRITQTLLPFARVNPEGVALVDVPDAVRVALQIADNEIRHRAQLQLDLAPVPGVLGHRERLEQLVTNLVLNAAHAIVEGSVGENTIRVRTYAEEGWVVLEVHDTGVGISPSVRARLLDSFFTTRSRMDGTGLGLAVSASIASELGGTIEYVETPDAAGVLFRVRLPAASESAQRERPSSIAPPAAPTRILIVDDDALVLRAYGRTLGRKHDVVVAGSGKDALDILRLDASFDAILCDVMMPSMDGPQLHAKIAELYPDLATKMVFCTGGAFTARTLDFVEGVAARVLTKPVALEDLDAAIALLALPPSNGTGSG